MVDAFEEDSFVLGLHAFSLEENRRFDEGLALAERAMALNPKDAWAVHAMAHVHYERGDNARGIEALPRASIPAIISDTSRITCSGTSPSCTWPRGATSGWSASSRACSATSRSPPDPTFRMPCRSRGSSTSSAIRTRARWQHLGAAARGWLDLPLLLFHDAHVAMALAAAGDWPSAELQLDRLRQRGKKTRNATLPEVLVPLIEGLHAFARGEYRAAVERLEPIDARIVEVGGSHAQRELFHDTLLAAALRAELYDRARPLLDRRLGKRPNPGHYWTTVRPAPSSESTRA